MSNLILMAYDECGDEVRVAGYDVSPEILKDEDMLEAYKEIKIRREVIPDEWHDLHWVNRYEMERRVTIAVRDFFGDRVNYDDEEEEEW